MRRRILASIGKSLPYNFIERVHFSGESTCYIDTDFKANTTKTRFVGAFSFDDLSTYRMLVGSRNVNTANSESCNIWIFNDKRLRLDWNTYPQFSQILSVGKKYNVDFTRGMCIVDGVQHTGGYVQSVNQNNNFLIGNATNGSQSPYSDGLLGWCYECSVFSSDEVIKNYKPCVRRSDGAVGFLESISGDFVTNSGFSLTA